MVLAKLLRVSKLKIESGQRLTLPELDALLDVSTDDFAANAKQLVRAFTKAKATLDLLAFRAERAETVKMAGPPELPDIRDAAYQADLKRIQPMDRQEEFRMARRHEFLVTLVTTSLTKFGLSADAIATLLKQPAHQVIAALQAQPEARGIDRDWVEATVLQFEELRNLYVEGALYIVLSTVNRYRGLGVDTADLIQEGNASLFQAIDGFDWRRDVRFRTYAQYWVHQAVLKMLYNSSRTVRVPIWVQKILGKIRRAQKAGRREGRELTHAEIAERIGVPEKKVDVGVGDASLRRQHRR